MIRCFPLAIIFLFLSCNSDNAASDNEEVNTKFIGEIDWIKNYGGSGEDTAKSIILTADGGYAVFGFSNSTDGDMSQKTSEVNDYWLLKLDAEGNIIWSKTYGGSKDDRGQRVKQTADLGYIIIGYSQSSDGDASNNEGFHDNWILKLNASGNVEWERSFGFSGHDHAYDVLQTTDGGYFFVGFVDVTASGGAGADSNKGRLITRHGVGEFWGTKLDGQGNLEWRHYFGGTANDRAYGVVQSNDGGFVLAGSTESSDFDVTHNNGSYDFWVIKITNSGELVWEKSFGGTGIDSAASISKTSDNGYVITGSTFSLDMDVSHQNGGSDVWLIKIDDNGQLVWEKTYGGQEFDAAENVSLCANGGFLVSGNSKSNDFDLSTNKGENDFWLIKTDENGHIIWQTTFGGANLDFGFDAKENFDGSIVLVGETLSDNFEGLQNKGKTDAVVIKIK
jgi:hypothetical protein